MKLSTQLRKEKEKYIQSQFNDAVKVCGLKKYKGNGYQLLDDVIIELEYSYNYRNNKLATYLKYAPKFLDEIYWKVDGLEEEFKDVSYYKRLWFCVSLGTEVMDYTLDIVNDETDFFTLFQNNINQLLENNKNRLQTAGNPYRFIDKLFEIMYETKYCDMFFDMLMCYVYAKHYKLAMELVKVRVKHDDIGPRIQAFRNGVEKGIYEYTIDFCKEHMKENVDLHFQNSLPFDDILINEREIEFILLENDERINEDAYWNQFKKRLDEVFRYIVSGQIMSLKENFSDYEIKIQLYFQQHLSQDREEELNYMESMMRRNHKITLEWDVR